MDFILFSRRIAMHGFALTIMLNKLTKKFVSDRSEKKALATVTNNYLDAKVAQN